MHLATSVVNGALIAQASPTEPTSLWVWIALATALVTFSGAGLFVAARALRRRLVPVKVRKR